MDVLPESRILELGCGAAHLWMENLDRVPAAWDVLLSDVSLGMLQQAQRNLCDSQRDFGFALIDDQTIPLGDQTFDAVIANHMLYHGPNRVNALAEIRRVLRPGGRLYASTVGRAHLRELSDWVRRFGPRAILGAGKGHPESFVLENGFDQLSQSFSQVTLQRYNDALVITTVEPVITNVRSTSARSALTGNKLAEFVHCMDHELTSHGAIHITRHWGCSSASAPEWATGGTAWSTVVNPRSDSLPPLPAQAGPPPTFCA